MVANKLVIPRKNGNSAEFSRISSKHPQAVIEAYDINGMFNVEQNHSPFSLWEKFDSRIAKPEFQNSQIQNGNPKSAW